MAADREWLRAFVAAVQDEQTRFFGVEQSRAVRTRADAVLSGLVLMRIDDRVLSHASSFKDPLLRALDAIHLASALSLGDDPDAFITYDARLARAAAKQRLRVQHPGIARLA